MVLLFNKSIKAYQILTTLQYYNLSVRSEWSSAVTFFLFLYNFEVLLTTNFDSIHHMINMTIFSKKKMYYSYYFVDLLL